MKKKCTTTYEDVTCWENFCEAWEEFIRGKRKKKDVQEFARNLGDEILALVDDFSQGRYRHGAYQHFAINDPKPRSIHKATVRDRLVHHAVHRQLYDFFAERFIADSFSCQTGKGVHKGLDRFRAMARKVGRNGTVTCWVLKCDIQKFFASVDHEILLSIIRRTIADDRLITLLQGIVQSYFVVPGKGIPLGNLTSQLFANVYMDVLDQFVKNRLGIRWYIRYADDFVLLSLSRQELEEALPKMVEFLQRNLRLTMHPKKISLRTFASGIDFLGWIHFPHHRLPRTKTKNRIMKRVKCDNRDAVLASYLGVLSHGNAHVLQKELFNAHWLWHGGNGE